MLIRLLLQEQIRAYTVYPSELFIIYGIVINIPVMLSFVGMLKYQVCVPQNSASWDQPGCSQKMSIELAHICRMDFPSLSFWRVHFQSQGNLEYCFIFISFFYRNSCKQTVETQMRMRRHTWVYTVCLCPKIRTPGLYRLMNSDTCFVLLLC